MIKLIQTTESEIAPSTYSGERLTMRWTAGSMPLEVQMKDGAAAL